MSEVSTRRRHSLPPLRVGDLVRIFQEPYTSTAPEGRAILRKRLQRYPDFSERWLVQFPPDSTDELYERIVLREHKEAKG